MTRPSPIVLTPDDDGLPEIQWDASEGRFVELIYQDLTFCEPQARETPIRFVIALAACVFWAASHAFGAI